MATQSKSLQRIYDLRALGGDQVVTALKKINDALAENARLKALANKKVATAEEIAEIEKYRAKIKELTIEENKLKIEQKELTIQSQQLANARKAEKLANKESEDSVKSLAGSYNLVKAQMRELYPLLKAANESSQITFQGRTLNFSQAIEEYKKLSAAEQNFRRNFTKDNLLVGEYTTGILQAFRSAGLDDLIKGQVDRTKQQINSLDASFEGLKQELSSIKVSGQGSFEAVEREMIENRNEAIRLRQTLKTVQDQMNGFGGIGSQVISGIKQNFNDLKADIIRAGIAYLSFQGIVNAAQSVFATTVQLDSLDAALKNTATTTAELAINEEFLANITERLGLVYTDTASSFKNFYAAATQAGIPVAQTRDIYESAAVAGTNLKLSQQEMNSVLLAFGQIASKGKVQAEELRGQIGERLPGAFALAAKAMGVSQQQLNKMLEDGKVLSNDFLPKFAVQLRNAFGGDSGQKVSGLAANVNRLKNSFIDLVQRNQGTLTVFFSAIIAGVGFLINSLPILITLLSVLAVNWAVQNAQMLLLRAQMIGYNIAIGASYIAMGILTVVQIAYNAVLFITNGALALVNRGLALFGITLRASTGPLAVIGTLLAVLAASFAAFGEDLTSARAALSEFVRLQRINNEIAKEASKTISDQVSIIDSWITVIRSSATSADTKRAALEKLIEINPLFRSALQGQTVDLQSLAKAYDLVTTSIRTKVQAEVAAKLSAEKNQRVAELAVIRQRIETEFALGKGSARSISGFTDTELDVLFANVDLKNSTLRRAGGDVITFFEQDYEKIIAALQSKQKKAEGVYNDYLKVQADLQQKQLESEKRINDELASQRSSDAKSYEVDIENLKSQISQLDEQINKFKGSQAELTKLIQDRKKLQEQLDNALGKEKKQRAPQASRLSAPQKDAFKDIDAIRDEQLAQLKLDLANRLLTEEDYLIQARDVNIKAADDKIKLLAGKNAEERKQIADLKLYKITQEQETNDKIFELRSKFLDRRLQLEEQEARAELDKKNAVPLLREPEAIRNEGIFLQQSLARQESYNRQMDLLEKRYGQSSVETAEARKAKLLDIQRQIFLNAIRLIAAQHREEERLNAEAAQKQQNEIKAITAARIIAVLENNQLSPEQKANRIRQIELEQTKILLAQEVAAARLALVQKEKALRDGLATEAEVSEAKAKLKLAEMALLKFTTDNEVSLLTRVTNALKGAWNNLTGFFKGMEVSKADIERAIQDGMALINQAISGAKDLYFQNQQAQVDRDRDLAIKRLNLQEEQILATASSEAEKESIRRRFEARREQEEKLAGQKKKKIALQQATIDFALAAIKTLAAYPFPFSLIPLAGLTAMYFLQRAQIQAQQFAKGGRVMPLSNGRINARQNIQTQPNGDNVLATVRVGEVILNEEQQRRLGGARTFRALGVPGFADGGLVGSMPGSSLRPPQDMSFLNGGSDRSIQELKQVVIEQQKIIVAQSIAVSDMANKIDTLKVAVVASEVDIKNTETKKASAVATL